MKNILWFALKFPVCLECVTDVTSCRKRKPTHTLHRCCRLEPTQEGDQLDHQRHLTANSQSFGQPLPGGTGMLGNSSVQCAVATAASLASLSLLGLLCLRCKRKSKTIHEDAQIYNPHTFQREGSRFAVMQSKRVTKTNQMITSSNEDVCPRAVAGSPPRSWEHIYVDPLPVTVYENELTPLKMKVADPVVTYYANVVGAALINNDADDYENSEFLAQNAHQLENDLLYENEKAA
ncbi:LAT2 domain-containing protein isoform X2 [Phyllopteryx taeniolatus]|uniref:LAT2 domain-containing protein isoform X2 n=1 Tax=Phyllopteryx taeniolatus TaxID=161469 RepID=UPI002AD38E7F|nr:LAT2 domain-containing protein isoform X2 [Phyllopteryx taeniolatus]